MSDPSALLDRYRKAGRRLATAESCTGGMVAARLTDIAGSSDVVERGFVTYSNEAKVEMLGVAEATLDAHVIVEGGGPAVQPFRNDGGFAAKRCLQHRRPAVVDRMPRQAFGAVAPGQGVAVAKYCFHAGVESVQRRVLPRSASDEQDDPRDVLPDGGAPC